FAADLSHELKNPVAAIRASAELLLDGALAEPEQAQRFVSRIQESVERIERLLGDLLSLARIEARGVEHFAPLDLGALVRTVCESASSPERLDLRVQAKVQVRGEPDWLTRALSNLVENALHHSTEGSRATVTVEREEGLVFVSVSSSGAIAKHARDRVFLRFFTTRADKGGSGLGLPIARAVAEAHRGR